MSISIILDLPTMLGNSFKHILRNGGWLHGDFHPMGSNPRRILETSPNKNT